ncbi:MAG: type II toxin-antitoxin system RelE/ParE family toxin [Bacteroidota bacterium]
MSRPKYDVRLLRIAENDLADILSYIAPERPSAALGQTAKIEKSLNRLKSNPHLGRLPNDTHLIELGCRCLIIEDYLAFYTIEEHTVFVRRIVHGARDYHSLF